MGSNFSSASKKKKNLDQDFREKYYQIFTNLYKDCYLAAGACYFSAEKHEKIARYSDKLASLFGVFSAGGFGLMHFYKEGLTSKGRGVIGGTSTVLAACFALSAFFHGMKDTSRSPSALSILYNETAAEWDELQHILDYYRQIKVRDPRVNVSELEMMTREILRRRKEIGLKAKVEEWAFKRMVREEAFYSKEIAEVLEPPKTKLLSQPAVENKVEEGQKDVKKEEH